MDVPGLKVRGITRDLKWGTPVPLEGYEDNVGANNGGMLRCVLMCMCIEGAKCAP